MLYIFCYKVFIVNKLVDRDQLFLDYSWFNEVIIKGSVFFCTFCVDFLSENSNADHFEVICCLACRIQSLIDFCVKEKRAGQTMPA